MNPTPSNTRKRLTCLAVFAILFLALLLLVLFIIGLFSGRLSYKLVTPVYVAVLGVGWLIASIRKFRQRRASGRQVLWYTQPGILFAMSMFLFLPVDIAANVTNGNFPNGHVILIASLIPIFLLFIAATYFWVRRFTHPFED